MLVALDLRAGVSDTPSWNNLLYFQTKPRKKTADKFIIADRIALCEVIVHNTPSNRSLYHHPAIRLPSPFAFNSAISIGPSENSPRSVRLVKSLKYPPAELMKFDRSRMHAIATAAFSGPMASQAS